jgi:proteasome lid subunit RPN8/RPN11
MRAIFDHAAEGFPLEIGGYCLGFPLVDHDLQARATLIEDTVRAITTSTASHVTMHAESFHAVERRRVMANNVLVGYYHSHPALSVFQSCEDVSNFRAFHPEDYQIAIVADSSLAKPDALEPHASWIGFFAWDDDHDPVKLPSENLFVVEKKETIFTLLPTLQPVPKQPSEPSDQDG